MLSQTKVDYDTDTTFQHIEIGAPTQNTTPSEIPNDTDSLEMDSTSPPENSLDSDPNFNADIPTHTDAQLAYDITSFNSDCLVLLHSPFILLQLSSRTHLVMVITLKNSFCNHVFREQYCNLMAAC